MCMNFETKFTSCFSYVNFNDFSKFVNPHLIGPKRWK